MSGYVTRRLLHGIGVLGEPALPRGPPRPVAGGGFPQPLIGRQLIGVIGPAQQPVAAPGVRRPADDARVVSAARQEKRVVDRARELPRLVHRAPRSDMVRLGSD